MFFYGKSQTRCLKQLGKVMFTGSQEIFLPGAQLLMKPMDQTGRSCCFSLHNLMLMPLVYYTQHFVLD